jgi:hypothetical protein
MSPATIPSETRVPDGPIHTHFGLSYASYLVMNRTVLQSMPIEWQERFVACLEEVEEAFGHLGQPPYEVRCRAEDGRFVADPIPNYQRGRARLTPASSKEGE